MNSIKYRKFGLASGRHTVVRKNKHGCKKSLAVKVSKGQNICVKIYRKKALSRAVKVVSAQNDCLKDTYRMCRKKELTFIISKVKHTTSNGYRLMDMHCLNEYNTNVSTHIGVCTKAQTLAAKGLRALTPLTETNRLGLATVLKCKCEGCSQVFSLSTSSKLPIDGKNHYDVNVRAVWGSMACGIGCANLNELMATLDAPGMNNKTFSKIECEVGNWWHSVLETDMLLAGEEERKLAIECNSFHHGVPAITVIVDGGWSKRTHKHSYNAPGGVGIIIGQKTGKILHIGVRNKYCAICRQTQTKNVQPKEHECFKNWSESSQSMEKDIILEGFLNAEKNHGLRYMKVIADGDSSVFANIQEHVPIWGKYVEKVECSNHVCKCLRSSLEKLVTDNANYRGKHKLTKLVRIKLVSSVRCAIRLRSSISDKKQAARLLKHDIMNSVHHIFGNHAKCSDFCKANKGAPEKVISDAEDAVNDDEVGNVLDKQVSFWTDGTALQQQEDARKASDLEYTDLTKHMLADVSVLLSRVADKSDRLLENTTTNLAECWMHVRSKFDGGKVTNRTQRGSWHARCYGAAVRQISGPQWAPKLWTQVTGSPAGNNFINMYKIREQQLKTTKMYTKTQQQQKNRYKRKLSTTSASKAKKGKMDYGPHATDVVDDVTTRELEALNINYKHKHIDINEEKIKIIENSTKTQSHSGLWFSERKKRITASNFGKIVKRNSKLKVEPLVRELLYSKFTGNRYTLKGLQEERTTIQEYILQKATVGHSVTVQPVGLCISREEKFLAASPDGLIKEKDKTGILEIKKLLHTKSVSLNTAAKEDKNFCLHITDGNLSLKKSHPYYFQCQGQMGVTNNKSLPDSY